MPDDSPLSQRLRGAWQGRITGCQLGKPVELLSLMEGDPVTAGLETDCNGATVGELWGLQGKPIPPAWTSPWQGRVAVTLSGVGELSLDALMERSAALTERIASEAD